MSGDGGSIPGRDVLVNIKKATHQVKNNERNLAIWNHCALSQESLKHPIVVCGYGKLYNEVSVVEKINDNDKFTGEGFSHLKQMTDVRKIKSKSCVDFNKYVCPVSGLKMSDGFSFVFIWSCGCIIAKNVMNEIPKDFVCLNCTKRFLSSDIVYLYPTKPYYIEKNAKNLEIRKRLQINN